MDIIKHTYHFSCRNRKHFITIENAPITMNMSITNPRDKAAVRYLIITEQNERGSSAPSVDLPIIITTKKLFVGLGAGAGLPSTISISVLTMIAITQTKIIVAPRCCPVELESNLREVWSFTIIENKASFVKGMSEFLEGEVSLVCRKIILIHGQNPGFCYF